MIVIYLRVGTALPPLGHFWGILAQIFQLWHALSTIYITVGQTLPPLILGQNGQDIPLMACTSSKLHHNGAIRTPTKTFFGIMAQIFP